MASNENSKLTICKTSIWLFLFICFTSFTAKVLTNLSSNLVQKSKIYDTSALQSVFLLNNYNYITKSLHKCVYFIC